MSFEPHHPLLVYEHQYRGVSILYPTLGLGVILSLIIHSTTTHDKLPRYDLVFHIFGLILSVNWIFISASTLVAFLDAIALWSQIDKILIGFTMLAWGNSLGDFLANSALAREGLGVMAVTGCFAG